MTQTVPNRATAVGRGAGLGLRGILIGLDAAAVASSWLLTMWLAVDWRRGVPRQLGRGLLFALALSVVSLLLIRAAQLYRARVSDARTLEVARLLKVAGIVGVFGFFLSDVLDLNLSIAMLAGGAALSFTTLNLVRSGFRGWLKNQRRLGRFLRPVVVVGANGSGLDLVRSIRLHPEQGYRLVGIMGPRYDDGELPEDVRWLGPADDTLDALDVLRSAGANGAFLAPGALPQDETNRLVRTFLAHGLHVHVSTGLEGIGHRRLLPQRMAYDTLFYLEPPQLQPWQRAAKRAMDLGLIAVALPVVVPVMLLCALAVRFSDGGPALFRQERVGRDGAVFGMWKFRTMVVDAAAQRGLLDARNEREGILFKVSADPRVTRVGRVLRALSLDELPQLFNVVRGEMSLVGPRPALPSEVAQFPARLRDRETVPPGITGLWQVEARDHPSFRAYERFDLYYVENWSVLLDVAILLTTLVAVGPGRSRADREAVA